MREREPGPDESFRPGGRSAAWPLAQVPDLSLVLGHGADAPDPADLGEPPAVTHALSQHVAHRLSRRQVMAAGIAASAVGALAHAPASAAAAVSRAPSRGRGTAASLSAGIDVDYLREVTETLTGFGDTSSGWRPGGSPANLEAVTWISREMRAVGMTQVAELPVPIDRWVFRGASVAIPGGATYDASSWGGVPGTPAGGITAEVLDLGLGQAADYEGVDATGKIVLVNWAYGDYWVNRHGHQATLEGALAVIFYTGTTAAGAFYNVRDDGLLSFDGTYDDDWVPFVFVTRNAANDLRASIAAGPTTVTLTADVELTRAEDGGVGYNVLGAIPGSDRSDEFIIFTGHHDAWFRGAADDATAVAAMLAIGKAVRETGFRPRRTLLFLASTNEEYGYTDAYYEWLVGCWYAVTNQRPDWSRKAILSLDFELLGTGDPGERLLIRTHSELLAHAVEKQLSDPSRTPFGAISQNVVWANADHFTLTAAGIPGIYFNTVGTQYLTRNYHTNYDVVANVNFDYLRQNIEVDQRHLGRPRPVDPAPARLRRASRRGRDPGRLRGRTRRGPRRPARGGRPDRRAPVSCGSGLPVRRRDPGRPARHRPSAPHRRRWEGRCCPSNGTCSPSSWLSTSSTSTSSRTSSCSEMPRACTWPPRPWRPETPPWRTAPTWVAPG